MKLYTTVKALEEKNACYDDKRWKDFMTKMNITSEDQPFDISSCLKVTGIKDCVWALCTQDSKDIARFNADVASLVLPIYQKRYPSDKRVRHCISLTYKYAVGLCSKADLKKAANAAYAAADIAYAAYAYAAAYAAYANAYANAAAAADTYAYATNVATVYAAYEEIWNKIEELFIEYFSE